jgi:hypothetical protein
VALDAGGRSFDTSDRRLRAGGTARLGATPHRPRVRVPMVAMAGVLGHGPTDCHGHAIRSSRARGWAGEASAVGAQKRPSAADHPGGRGLRVGAAPAITAGAWSAGMAAGSASVRRAQVSTRLPTGAVGHSSWRGVPRQVVQAGVSMGRPAAWARWWVRWSARGAAEGPYGSWVSWRRRPYSAGGGPRSLVPRQCRASLAPRPRRGRAHRVARRARRLPTRG